MLAYSSDVDLDRASGLASYHKHWGWREMIRNKREFIFVLCRPLIEEILSSTTTSKYSTKQLNGSFVGGVFNHGRRRFTVP